MDCCAHNRGLNNVFDDRHARDRVAAYWKKGLERPARRLADLVAARGIAGAHVLEVGAGIGDLYADLLQRGAARVTSVELSEAYQAAAQEVAGRLGLRDRVDYLLADFARQADSIPEADVVVMHRVVCCYPDMAALVTAAARRARHLLALSFPHTTWYTRPVGALMNLGLRLSGSTFRVYLHDPGAILDTAARAGLRLVQRGASFPWQIVLLQRAATE